MNFKKCFIALLENRQKKPKTFDIEKIKSILIRPMGYSIGDGIVHTAHIQQIKSLYPHIKIGVLVTNDNREIFKHSQLVDEFIERNIASYIKQHKKWDLLLDFKNNFSSEFLLMDRILMPKQIMIFRKYNKKHYNLDTIKNYDFHCDQAEQIPLSYFLSNSLFNKNNELPEPHSVLRPNLADKSFADDLWQADKFRVLLCPQGSLREIPAKELADFLNQSVSEQMREKIDFLVSYTSSSARYFNELTSYLDNGFSVSLSPKSTISEYINLVSRAEFVIAVDGGSLHLSCAFDKPLISFFANCQPNLSIWKPLLKSDVPHCLILTKNKKQHSNETADFDMAEGILFFSEYLSQKF